MTCKNRVMLSIYHVVRVESLLSCRKVEITPSCSHSKHPFRMTFLQEWGLQDEDTRSAWGALIRAAVPGTCRCRSAYRLRHTKRSSAVVSRDGRRPAKGHGHGSSSCGRRRDINLR